MVSCSVIDCSVTYNNNPNRETFHRFPVCARLREDWILKLNRKYWEPVKSSMVCSRHFKDSCFVQRNQRRLIKKGSIPTEFISAPSTSQQNNTQRKRKAPIPEAKNIIASVYRYLQTEFENLKSYTGGSCDLRPLANILKRTATATGVSEETVTAILEEEKTSEESIHDSVPSKRGLIQDFEDEDVSPIEEESSCGSADDAQHDDGESQIDIEEHPIETLKVEVEDSDGEHSGARRGLWLQIEPLSTQKVPAIHQLLPPTHAEVKQEPVDNEVHELMEGGDAVEGTASVEDPLCESTSAVHHLLCSTDFEIKSEPPDDVYQDMEFSATEVQRRPD